jgi:broad specificity phosphatase PhoE
MKTRLIIIRHGETDYNIKGLFQGQLDSVLTERGIRQAEYTAERLKDTRMDAIYASPLKRALATAEIVRGGRDVPICVDERIQEIGCGHWEGLEVDRIKRDYAHGFENWTTRPHLHRIDGGETFREVFERASEFIRDVTDKHRGQSVVIVSHMVAILLMLLYLTDDRIENTWNTPRQPNTAVSIVEIDGSGRVEIPVRGDNSHLPDEDACGLAHEMNIPERRAVNFT